VILDFERNDLNKEKLRELIVAECQHYLDIRKTNQAKQASEAQ